MLNVGHIPEPCKIAVLEVWTTSTLCFPDTEQLFTSVSVNIDGEYLLIRGLPKCVVLCSFTVFLLALLQFFCELSRRFYTIHHGSHAYWSFV